MLEGIAVWNRLALIRLFNMPLKAASDPIARAQSKRLLRLLSYLKQDAYPSAVIKALSRHKSPEASGSCPKQGGGWDLFHGRLDTLAPQRCFALAEAVLKCREPWRNVSAYQFTAGGTGRLTIRAVVPREPKCRV